MHESKGKGKGTRRRRMTAIYAALGSLFRRRMPSTSTSTSTSTSVESSLHLPDDLLREIAARSGLDAGIRRTCRSLALTREERLRAFLVGLERRAWAFPGAGAFPGAVRVEVSVDVQDGPTLAIKGIDHMGVFTALVLDALLLRDDARQSVDIKVTIVYAADRDHENEHEHEHEHEAVRRLAHATLSVSSRSSLFAGTRGIAMRIAVCVLSDLLAPVALATELLSVSTRGFGTNRFHPSHPRH